MSTSDRLTAGSYKAVFFDLDGTLVDTAPDMVTALQQMQRALDVEPVEYEFGRNHVSNGALGLLRIGFPDLPEHERQELVGDYVDRYAGMLCDRTSVFPGLDPALDALDAGALPWGVVTNKPERLTNPLLQALDLFERSAATVSGDTLPQRKPDPAPLLHACALAGVAAIDCIYVGDAARDIEAGKRAGMATIAAAYGYIADDDDPRNWNPDLIATDTDNLTQILLKAVNLVA